jgi:hypothetical protein
LTARRLQLPGIHAGLPNKGTPSLGIVVGMRKFFARLAYVYEFGPYAVLVYSKNLLTQLR